MALTAIIVIQYNTCVLKSTCEFSNWSFHTLLVDIVVDGVIRRVVVDFLLAVVVVGALVVDLTVLAVVLAVVVCCISLARKSKEKMKMVWNYHHTGLMNYVILLKIKN